MPLIRRWNADKSGFKAIKEGLNSFQLLENIAGSGQRSQRKRFVVRRRSGKGTWSWITELGKLKWGIRSRSNIVWWRWQMTVESETRALTSLLIMYAWMIFIEGRRLDSAVRWCSPGPSQFSKHKPWIEGILSRVEGKMSRVGGDVLSQYLFLITVQSASDWILYWMPKRDLLISEA